jgi:DNA-binding protein HU-beta
MNTAELAEHLAAKRGITKTDAKADIDIVFAAIAEAAAAGEEISIPGFGKFKVASRPAREGRNPSTGATITIAASKKLSFTPAKAVKDALNAPSKGKK